MHDITWVTWLFLAIIGWELYDAQAHLRKGEYKKFIGQLFIVLFFCIITWYFWVK